MTIEEVPVDSVSVLEGRIISGTHELVVKNYSLFKGIGKNKAIESAIFSVGGYEWKIMFYPDGYDAFANYEAGNASLKIRQKSKRCDKGILQKVEIVSQSGKGVQLCSTSQFSFKLNRNVGYANLINKEILEGSGEYLKDDCLKIRVTIGVITSKLKLHDMAPLTFGSALKKCFRFCCLP